MNNDLCILIEVKDPKIFSGIDNHRIFSQSLFLPQAFYGLGGELLIMRGFQIKLYQTVGEEDKDDVDRIRLESGSRKSSYPPAVLDLIDTFLDLRAAGIKLARLPRVLPFTGKSSGPNLSRAVGLPPPA